MGHGLVLGRSEVKAVETIQMCAQGKEIGFARILCELVAPLFFIWFSVFFSF